MGENTEFLTSSLFNSSSNPSQGLFSPTNILTVELTVSPIKSLNLRFLYNRSHLRAIAGQVGGAIGEPIYGFANDGFDGSIVNATGDTYAFNFDWLVTDDFGLFGRYAYASTNINPLNASRPNDEAKAQTIQVGAAFPDLGKEGALFTFSYLIPFSVVDGRYFLVSGSGNSGVQYEFEVTYFYLLSQKIALVPAFYWIGNPNNFSKTLIFMYVIYALSLVFKSLINENQSHQSQYHRQHHKEDWHCCSISS